MGVCYRAVGISDYVAGMARTTGLHDASAAPSQHRDDTVAGPRRKVFRIGKKSRALTQPPINQVWEKHGVSAPPNPELEAQVEDVDAEVEDATCSMAAQSNAAVEEAKVAEATRSMALLSNAVGQAAVQDESCGNDASSNADVVEEAAVCSSLIAPHP